MLVLGHDSASHKDLDFWLEDMETKMASEDLGKDMASVNALLKKHQHHEADMMAHEVRETKTDRKGSWCLYYLPVHNSITSQTHRRESKISMLKLRNLWQLDTLMPRAFRQSKRTWMHDMPGSHKYSIYQLLLKCKQQLTLLYTISIGWKSWPGEERPN